MKNQKNINYTSEWISEKWTVGQYIPTDGFKTVDNHSCVCQFNKNLIAITGPADDIESQKLADLISAAPELLQFLKEAIEVLIDHSLNDEIKDKWLAVLDKAQGVK
jgi:hypothetical protein